MRHGFVYERVPHVTLKSIANNAEIDVIWERWQASLEPLRAELNRLLGERGRSGRSRARRTRAGPSRRRTAHAAWWEARIARQKEIDASIARNAEIELLYDRPYEKKGVVRVTGPFTVESLSPHRVLPADEDDPWLGVADGGDEREESRTQPPPTRGQRRPARAMVGPAGKAKRRGRRAGRRFRAGGAGEPEGRRRAEHQEGRAAGVHRAAAVAGRRGSRRRGAIWRPGRSGGRRSASGRSTARSGRSWCARPRGGGDVFDTLVVCGFAFEAQVGQETLKLGRLTVLKARMNQDLHMGDALKKTGRGQPVRGVRRAGHRAASRRATASCEVEIRGVDIFDPTTGEVRSSRTRRGHRLLVHRHRLRRGELLRPPRLFPAAATTPTRS